MRGDERLIKNVLVNKIKKIRPLVRPKTRWFDVVEKYLLTIDQKATLQSAREMERYFVGNAGPEC